MNRSWNKFLTKKLSNMCQHETNHKTVRRTRNIVLYAHDVVSTSIKRPSRWEDVVWMLNWRCVRTGGLFFVMEILLVALLWPVVISRVNKAYTYSYLNFLKTKWLGPLIVITRFRVRSYHDSLFLDWSRLLLIWNLFYTLRILLVSNCYSFITTAVFGKKQSCLFN